MTNRASNLVYFAEIKSKIEQKNIISLRTFASYFFSQTKTMYNSIYLSIYTKKMMTIVSNYYAKISFAETIINHYLLFSLMMGFQGMEPFCEKLKLPSQQITILRKIDRLNRIIVLQIEWEMLFKFLFHESDQQKSAVESA